MLAFHFPEYLTTPQLRRQYSVDVLRQAMFALLVAGGLSLANLVLGVRRNLNLVAFALVIAAVAFGGTRGAGRQLSGQHALHRADWFILDLLGSTLVFIVIETVPAVPRPDRVPTRMADRPLLAVNHLLVGLILFAVNFTIHHGFGWLVSHDFQLAVQRIWFVPQLLLCAGGGPCAVLDASCVPRGSAAVEIPRGAPQREDDGLACRLAPARAGNHLHARVCVLAPLFVIGFSEAVINAYIVIVGFQAVLNHANVHLPWGPEIPDRDAGLPPLASRLRRRGDRPQLRRALTRSLTTPVRHRGQGARAQAVPREIRSGVGDYMPDGWRAQQGFPFRAKPLA